MPIIWGNNIYGIVLKMWRKETKLYWHTLTVKLWYAYMSVMGVTRWVHFMVKRKLTQRTYKTLTLRFWICFVAPRRMVCITRHVWCATNIHKQALLSNLKWSKNSTKSLSFHSKERRSWFVRVSTLPSSVTQVWPITLHFIHHPWDNWLTKRRFLWIFITPGNTSIAIEMSITQRYSVMRKIHFSSSVTKK